MLNIPEYKEYGGETKIALMDNSSLAFMHELSQRSYPSDGILSVYDLILIPKWVMEEIEDSTYRSTYVEQLQAQGYPIRWIDETKYGAFVNDEDVNLYYIVEAAVSRVSELMRFLRRKVKTEDLIDLPSAEEWMNRLYDEWPIHGRTLSTGRTLKKNAGEISLTILAEIFAWYHDEVDSLTIYTQDTDAHEFQTNAERILTGKTEFTPALDSPISVAFKSNDFILCQMYREGALTLEAVRQLRHDDRKLTYTRQQADKSIICRKEVITKEQFIDLIQDATVQIVFGKVVLVSSLAVDWPFGVGLRLYIEFAQAVDYDVGMDVACSVIAICMGADQSLMPRKISFCVFQPDGLCTFSC